VSIVNREFVNESNINSLKFKVSIIGVTNHSSSVVGSTGISIKFPTLPESIQFNLYVMDNFKYDVLLGTDFITHFNADLTFSTNSLIINEHYIPLEPFTFTHNLNENNHLNSSESHSISIPFSTDINNTNAVTNNNDPKQIFVCNLAKTYIPPQTIKRVQVQLTDQIKELNILEMTDNLARKSLFMPDILLRKQYKQNLTIPIINPGKNIIKLNPGFPIAKIITFEDLPIETIDFNDPSIIESTCMNIESNESISSDEKYIKNILSKINPLASIPDFEKISKLLISFKDIFSQNGEIGTINCYKHRIKLLPGATPIRRPPYRKPSHLEEFEREKVQELLNKGIIQLSSSPWGLGVVIVEKGHKEGEKTTSRLTIYYRP